MLEGKEALEKIENFIDALLRDRVVLDVEEPTGLASLANLGCNRFPLSQGAIDVAYVNRRDGLEACRFLGYLAIGSFRAGVEVHVLAVPLRKVLETARQDITIDETTDLLAWYRRSIHCG
jgi:hypothetical protein